jgi:hypothetical protein
VPDALEPGGIPVCPSVKPFARSRSRLPTGTGGPWAGAPEGNAVKRFLVVSGFGRTLPERAIALRHKRAASVTFAWLLRRVTGTSEYSC